MVEPREPADDGGPGPEPSSPHADPNPAGASSSGAESGATTNPIGDPLEVRNMNEPVPGEDPTSSDPAAAAVTGPAAEKTQTFLGVKLHNLIFVGMLLGLILGLGTWKLDHHDRLTLVDGTTVEVGDVAVRGDEYIVQRPGGEEVRYQAREVLSETLVRAEETGSGRLYAHLVWWYDLIGRTLFLSALKMIVAPLILASIVAGIVSLKGLDQLRRIGFKTMAYYVCTTCIAIGLGLAMVHLIQPGKRAAAQEQRAKREAKLAQRERAYTESTNLSARAADRAPTPEYLRWLDEIEAREAGTGHEGARYSKLTGARERSAGDMFKDDLIRPLLSNPFTSLTNANSLGVISFALLMGVAIVVVGARAEPVAAVFVGFYDVIVLITKWFMAFAPVCVAAIVAHLVATEGPQVFQTLGWYCATVIAGIFVHVGVLLTIAKVLGGVSPLALWRGLREALMIAFTTRSSAATLPVTVRCVTQQLGVSPRVANFGLPVGATMNMDGTALYEGVAVIFLLQIYAGLADVPIELGGAVTIIIFITAALASVGAAAVPDAGLVTMVLVANAVGLPIYYIPLIFAVDAFLDMFRTSTNVLGDSVGCLVVQRLEDRAGPTPDVSPTPS